MQRGPFAVVLAAVIGLHGGCKSNSKSKGKTGDVAAARAVTPTPPPPPTPPTPPAPDPGAPQLPTTAPDVKPELITPLGKDLVQVGTIKVDLAAGRLEIPAKVASPAAPLEYVAVTPDGKAYESLLTVETNSVELRLALSLIGFEGVIPSPIGEAPRATVNDTVLLAVIIGGKERPLSSLLVDRRTKRAPKDIPWQVIGFRDEHRDVALMTRDLFTLVKRDTFAPLRYTIEAGNPYAGPNVGYSGNPKAFPADGKLTLVVKRRAARTPG